MVRIPHDGSDRSTQRKNENWARVIDLDAASKRANDLATWPLWLVKLGAALNFAVLIFATITPEAEVSDGWLWGLLAICILPVVIGTTCLIGIAHVKIGSLERTFPP